MVREDIKSAFLNLSFKDRMDMEMTRLHAEAQALGIMRYSTVRDLFDINTIGLFREMIESTKKDAPQGVKDNARKYKQHAFHLFLKDKCLIDKDKYIIDKKPYELSVNELMCMLTYHQFDMDINKEEEQEFIDMMISLLSEDYIYNDLYNYNNGKNDEFDFDYQRNSLHNFYAKVRPKMNVTNPETQAFFESNYGDIINHEYKGLYMALNEYMKQLKVYKLSGIELYDVGTQYPISVKEIAIFWAFWRNLTNLVLWDKFKKVYRITNELAEDLLSNEEIRFPKSVLSHIPFKTFYIDLSENKFGDKVQEIEGVVVRIIRGRNGAYLIECNAFLKDNYSYKNCNIMIDIDEDEYVCNKELLKKKYNKKNISNISISEVRSARVLEQFVLSVVFYLCCANKRSRTKSVQYEVTNSHIVSYDEEIVGFVENDLICKGDKEDDDSVEKRDIAKSTKGHKPHLVRGHFHNYWCGKKGGRTLIPKYIEPYYTGYGSKVNTINITNCKKERTEK